MGEELEILNWFKGIQNDERNTITATIILIQDAIKEGIITIKSIDNIANISNKEKQKLIQYMKKRLKGENSNGKE